MKYFALILLAASLQAQPMVYNRLEESVPSSSPALLTMPFLDTGNLSANSGWIGEYELHLRYQCDAIRDSIYYSLTSETAGFPVTFGGICTSFSFPAGATLKANYSFFAFSTGYWWTRKVQSITPPLFVDTVWNTTDVGFNKAAVYYASPYPYAFAAPIVIDSSHTVSPTSRMSLIPAYLVNAGKVPEMVEAGPGDGPTYMTAMDTLGVLKIRFRIDIGETAGHVYLRWSALAKTDFAAWDNWLLKETWEEAFSGEPNFQTTILRGSTLTLYKLY